MAVATKPQPKPEMHFGTPVFRYADPEAIEDHLYDHIGTADGRWSGPNGGTFGGDEWDYPSSIKVRHPKAKSGEDENTALVGTHHFTHTDDDGHELDLAVTCKAIEDDGDDWVLFYEVCER